MSSSKRGVTTTQVIIIAAVVVILAVGGVAAYFLTMPAPEPKTVTRTQTQVETRTTTQSGTVTTVSTTRTLTSTSTVPIPTRTLKLAHASPTLHFYYTPAFGFAEELIAKEGVAMQVFRLRGPAEALQVLLSGEVDLAAVSVGISGKAWLEEQEDIVAIALPNLWIDWTLVAEKSIQEPQDLIGKTIAHHGTGSVTETHIYMYLEKNGISEDQVNIVKISGSSARAAAIRSGTIDATSLSTAFAIELEMTGDFNILESFGQTAPGVFDYWWLARGKWLENPENRELAKMYIKAMIESFRKANNEMQATISMSQYLSPDLYQQESYEPIYKEYVRAGAWPNDGAWNKENVMTSLEFWCAQDAGLKELNADPNELFDNLVDLSIAEEALQELG